MKNHSGKLLVLLAVCLLLFTAASAETAHEHQYTIVSGKSYAPTCTATGLTYYECLGCGDHYTVEIPAVGHKEGNTVSEITTKPTCQKTGIRTTTVYCKHCNTVISETTETLPLADHTWPSSWTVVKTPTCTESGLQVKNCTVCGTLLDSEVIAATGHDWGSWITVEASCTTGGYDYRVCGNDSSHVERRNETSPKGHQWGEYVVTKEPTCTETGEETSTCSVCGLIRTRTVAATGHNWGAYVQTKAPTCTNPGIETSTCPDCGETRTRTVAATGHSWDAGTVTTEPTCTTPGVKTYTCLNDPSHTYTESVAKLGHKWTNWEVDPKPTCTEKGRRRHSCTVCGTNYSESVQPLGHNWGVWTVVREATLQQPGLEQRTCQRCGEVEEREIPFSGGGAVMCVFGPRLKDVGTYLTPGSNAWYMFTPFDASVDGRQTYELVVDDSYIVGTATITVENGTVALEYDLNTESVKVDLEFFAFLPDMHILEQYEPEDLKPLYGMQTGIPYSIAERFGGDTNLVLYFCSRVTYAYDAANMSPLNYFSTYHQALLNNMFGIMDP